MILYWSSRHGHACPAITFKGHLLWHFHYIWSESQSCIVIWLLYVLYLVGLRFSPFSILAIHCNRRRETLSVPKYSLKWQNWTIIFGIQLVNLITVCTDGRDIVESADKGMTWHGTIRLFVSVAHSVRTRSSFKRLLYCGCKVLGVVQSTKCFVLKWETSVGFPPATFFVDVLFSRISKAS